MKGRFYKQGKAWYISYGAGKTPTVFEVDSREKGIWPRTRPQPTEAGVQVEFELNNKSVPDLKTLKLLVSAATSTQTTLSVTIPEKYRTQFSKLDPAMQKHVCSCIERRKDLSENDLKLLLTAAGQNFPLAFTSEEDFVRALLKLVSRARTHSETLMMLNSFESLTDHSSPICIMVHGSSVGGLRGRNKGNGWGFDKNSDIDISIIDFTRFCWAQALGIMTYSDHNTIELSDQHLHLLKLYNFAKEFRHIVKGRQTNFCVYKNREQALTHSGFTLVCEYSPPKGFTVAKLFVPEYEQSISPDKRVLSLEGFLEIQELPIQWETMATNEIVMSARGKNTSPSQGNHLFNDLNDSLETLIELLKKKLSDLNAHENPGAEFVTNYLGLIAFVAGELKLVSRKKEIAESIHGVKFCDAVMQGFQHPSDKSNELLYGNALTYFCNASLLLCRVCLIGKGSPKSVAMIIPPLKKAFSNLMDSAVDEKLITQLRKDRPLEAYALDLVNKFKNQLRNKVNRDFKNMLDLQVSGLSFDKVFQKLDLADITGGTLEMIFDEFDPEQLQWHYNPLYSPKQSGTV